MCKKTSHQNRVNLKKKIETEFYYFTIDVIFNDFSIKNVIIYTSFFLFFFLILSIIAKQLPSNHGKFEKKIQHNFPPIRSTLSSAIFSIKNTIEYPHFSRFSMDRKIIDIVIANDLLQILLNFSDDFFFDWYFPIL